MSAHVQAASMPAAALCGSNTQASGKAVLPTPAIQSRGGPCCAFICMAVHVCRGSQHCPLCGGNQVAQVLWGWSMLPRCLHGGEVRSAAAGAAGVARFVVAVPANVAHHVALPWSEKVTVYKGWWGTIKKEAKHYWVRG